MPVELDSKLPDKRSVPTLSPSASQSACSNLEMPRATRSVVLRKSTVDPSFFEIFDGVQVVREISIRFKLEKYPKQFASLMECEQWIVKEETRLAKSAAYRWLAVKSRSTFELKKKLLHAGFSAVVCEEVLQHVSELGYLQDIDDFAQRMIERELTKGYGPRYIELKLRSLGCDSAQVRRIITPAKQREAIRKLLPKLRHPGSALQRRGFDREMIALELQQ